MPYFDPTYFDPAYFDASAPVVISSSGSRGDPDNDPFNPQISPEDDLLMVALII